MSPVYRGSHGPKVTQLVGSTIGFRLIVASPGALLDPEEWIPELWEIGWRGAGEWKEVGTRWRGQGAV